MVALTCFSAICSLFVFCFLLCYRGENYFKKNNKNCAATVGNALNHYAVVTTV